MRQITSECAAKLWFISHRFANDDRSLSKQTTNTRSVAHTAMWRESRSHSGAP